MEDNKKDYSDFFKPSSDEQNRDREEENKQDRPSYYYSYGPYKSSPQEEHPQENSASSYSSAEPVEVTAPRPLRPYPYAQEPAASQQPAGSRNWQVNEPKKRSSAKGMFAAFMAGALVVSSLMFASDRMNLFSGGSTGATSGSPVAAATNNGTGSSSGSGNVAAAYDISRPGSVSTIVQQSSPAVVKIESYVTSKRSSSSLYNDPFFRYFFGDQQEQQPKSGTKQQSGMGTGFIFEKSGYIITNQHVIEGAEEIQVTVEGYEKPFTAKLLGNSFDLDLAVLKIEPLTENGTTKDFSILPIGDSSSMQIGDWVVAIGNPYGFEHTVTVGVLSAKEREISIQETSGTRNYKHLLQTDASINPGNSGGPLLNMNGEVVGINTAVNAEAQGIGFAIPTSTISEVIDSLKNNVEIPKEPIPFIGATLANVADLDAQSVKELQLDKAEGAYVQDVVIGTPAFKSGLKKYDVVTSMDGSPITNSSDMVSKIQAKKVGDKISFGIIRDGKAMTIEITLADKNEYLKQQQQQQQQQR
jgi:serine protease Do